MSGEWSEFRFGPGVDAYVDWVRDPGSKFFPKYDEYNVLYDVLIELVEDVKFEDFQDILAKVIGDIKSAEEALSKAIFTLTPYYEELGLIELDIQRFTARVNDLFFKTLQEEQSLNKLVNRVILAQKLPSDAVCEHGKPFQGPAVAGGSTPGTSTPKMLPTDVCVVGVIDEGIAFANERFRRDVCETRVEHIWIQDGQCSDQYPSDDGYGRMLSKPQIDQLLLDCEYTGSVDEDEVYRRSGLIDFYRSGHKAAAWRIAHGTHVMDLACGYPMGDSPSDCDGREGRPIVCVQLPTATVADTSGLGLEKYVLDGINYILKQADRIAFERGLKYVPVVINFSSGVRAGPHDGTHPIEIEIDKRVNERRASGCPTEFVLPSGNSHLARGHARISLQPQNSGNGYTEELRWRIQPDDRTFTFMEIWLPPRLLNDADVRVELTLYPPNGMVSPPLNDQEPPGWNAADPKQGKWQGYAWKPNGCDILCKVSYEYIGAPTSRGRFVIAVLPTAHPDALTDTAPSGDWTICVTNVSNKAVSDINAWIHWDDSPIGYRRTGRQSYFIDECYERIDEVSGRPVESDNPFSLVKRAGNINAIATGEETVVVGGYSGKELKAAQYSAGGPVIPKAGSRRPHRDGPDVMAVSEDSGVLLGILGAGTRSGSVVAMNGTSVAAPQIARCLAGALADGVEDGVKFIREKANGDERRMLDHEASLHSLPNPPSFERKGEGRALTDAIRPSQSCRWPS